MSRVRGANLQRINRVTSHNCGRDTLGKAISRGIAASGQN